jgi:hypothetical protein
MHWNEHGLSASGLCGNIVRSSGWFLLMMKTTGTKTNRRAAGSVTSEAQRIARPGAANVEPDAKANLRPFPHDLLEEAEQEPNYHDV